MRRAGCCDRRNQFSNVRTAISLAHTTSHRIGQILASVAVKCSKCGKARKTEPAEGKAMAAAATRDAGKTQLTVENVQEAVVKALATQSPAAAAFAGMHEFERGNGFSLGVHTAFRAIIEARCDS